MVKYNAIAADSHIEVAPTGWVERMPKEFRDQAPKVVKLPDGGDAVQIGNGQPAPLGLQITGGQKYSEFVTKGRSFADKLPGTGDPAQRVSEQIQDGDDAEVLYAAVVATSLRQIKDNRVLKEIAKAYNSWLSDYCSYAPDRLLGAAVMPPTNADDAVEELERVAKYPGIRLAQLLTFPNGGAWGTYGDEKFWAAANEIGLCITAHHNFGGEDKGKSHPLPGQGGDKPLAIEGAVDLSMFAWLLTCDLPLPTIPILTIEQLFLGGVLDRYPKLRFHFAETGIGWLPYWLEQVDDRFERHRHWAQVKLAKKPSTYVREHFTFSFQEDQAGVALRHMIGIDNICWASDFPHSVSDWPYSREVRERQFGNLPGPDRRKMEALNIACQVGLITKAEKEKQALEPIVKDVEFLKVMARNERRA
jgi:predicted TIM-barrel fold metal-dependent hydrolase